MNAQPKWDRIEEWVARRIPYIVMEREATHGCLAEAHGAAKWSPAMSAAYQAGDTAELGRLVAAAIHDRIVASADDIANDEASERFDV